MWDLRKTYSRSKREPHPLYTLEYAGSSSCCGYISMQMSPYGERIYVSCLDGKIYAYHLVNPILKPGNTINILMMLQEPYIRGI